MSFLSHFNNGISANLILFKNISYLSCNFVQKNLRNNLIKI